MRGPKRKTGRKYALAVTLVAVVAAIGLGLYGLKYVGNLLTGRSLNTAGKVEFEHKMPIPDLAPSTLARDGTRTFDLTLQSGVTSFFENSTTRTWGINSTYLGPTLRAQRGEKVQVNVKNNLPETTSIHWHGMHLPAKMDGGPHQPIEAAASWSPSWKIDQPAATLWYHPHPHGETEQHVERGLAGMFILDDDTPAAKSLPSTYGIDDLPVIVQDKRFDRNKQFDMRGGGPTGRLGDTILANGAVNPYVEVTTQRVRLRLLNGSTARIYNFGLSNGDAFELVATDGGLLERSVSLKRVMLSPGERAEIIVTMRGGQTVELRSYPQQLDAGFIAEKRIGAADTLDVLQLRAAEQLAPSAEVPAQLAYVERLAESAASEVRRFRLDSERSINGKTMDLRRVDFSVVRGATEVWEVTNMGGSPHSFHIHDVQFQVLAIGGSPPPPELAGWKDTILLKEGQTVRLIMRFSDYSDPSFSYMYHCHLLRHEDQGMMGQFVVIEPGATPPTELPASEHSHMPMN